MIRPAITAGLFIGRREAEASLARIGRLPQLIPLGLPAAMQIAALNVGFG
jgi:hypothetical protein